MTTAQQTYNKSAYSLLVRTQNVIRIGVYDGKPQVEQTCASLGGAYKSEFVVGKTRVEMVISLHTLPVNKFTLNACVHPRGSPTVRLIIEFERYDSEDSQFTSITLECTDEHVTFDSKTLAENYFTDDVLDIEDIYTEMYELYAAQLAAVNKREQHERDKKLLGVVKLFDKIEF